MAVFEPGSDDPILLGTLTAEDLISIASGTAAP
jgi:hypothetical protein